MLVQSETMDAATMRNIHMDADTRSAQLYYILITVCPGAQKHAGGTEGEVSWRPLLDEYEPRTAGRQPALLQELLHYGYPGHQRAALDEFEVLLRRFCALPGEDVSESLKLTLVQKRNTDDALKTHLEFHASRFSNFQLVYGEIRSVLIVLMTGHALGLGARVLGHGRSRCDKTQSR